MEFCISSLNQSYFRTERRLSGGWALILVGLRLSRSHFSICCPLIKMRADRVGGGSHRPPRLDKKHLTPCSPRLSGPVPTCRFWIYARGINPTEETSEFHSSAEKSNRQPDANMSLLCITPSFQQKCKVNIFIRHQDMVSCICSDRLDIFFTSSPHTLT